MEQSSRQHIIQSVLPGSIAEELGVEAGDLLLEINGEELEDVFDYRYLTQDEELEILIQKPDGEQWLLDIEKDYEEDLGIEFENDLMSEYHSCTNDCIFCFIDQMPKGMRETLYFKDDDSRLSFLQGNYITLTNMKPKDIDRIIRFHLAPINISIHTTNPQLRCKMLHNRFAGEVLAYLDRLWEHQIEMNGQIVLCKGVNDGAELERTIEDLSRYLPFMRSVSVVPAGITKFREGLYPLEGFCREDAQAVIDYIESRQRVYYERYGLHFIHASDEFYLLAQRDFPEEERYDGYIQLENGVGMMRLLEEEFAQSLQERIAHPDYSRQRGQENRVTIATAKLAYPLMKELSGRLRVHFPNVDIKVLCVQNRFFGEKITVAGLLTGQDLVSQLQSAGRDYTQGRTLLITSAMLRMGEEVFLDDMTLTQAREKLGMPIIPVGSSGRELLEAMLGQTIHMPTRREGFVYVQSYDREK